MEGRGKSVVCEAVLKGEIVSKVLKTSVSALVELNMVKNLFLLQLDKTLLKMLKAHIALQ